MEKKKSFLVVVSPSRCKLASRSLTTKVRRKKERRKGNGKKREEDRERVLTFIPFACRVLVSFLTKHKKRANTTLRSVQLSIYAVTTKMST